MNYLSVGKELVEDLIKSLKLKYCSKSSLPKVLSNTTAQKITEDTRKVKKLQKRVKTERALAVCLTTNKNDTPAQALPGKY